MPRLLFVLSLFFAPLYAASAQLAQSTTAELNTNNRVQFEETQASSGADTPVEEAEPQLFYIISQETVMYRSADSTKPYTSVKFREPVDLIRQVGAWSEVSTGDGARGYVLSSQIANTWIRVSKSQSTVFVYRGVELIAEIPADLGYNTFADKERRGTARDRDHWRTPEGTFYIVGKNPRSQFYKAFVLNYPNSDDAARGLRDGLISQAEYAAIVRAEQEGIMPPMNTALGGMIEIHGHGTEGRISWTQGCIAITDAQMDRLWDLVHVGTPVLVEP
jgi:hypothetical protein